MLILPVSIVLSFYFYKHQPVYINAGRGLKSALVVLRGIGIFLIVLLLFDLVFELKEKKIEKPVFITVIDNSASMLTNAKMVKIEKEISSFQEGLRTKFGNKLSFEEFIVDSDARVGKFDFEGKISNLNSAFDLIHNRFYNRNIAGIALISDGVYNQGINPLYTAKQIPFTPTYALGVGDTLLRRDHAVRDVLANKVAFLGNEFPLEVVISADKLKGRSVKLHLYEDGKLIRTEKLSYSKQMEELTLRFLVEAKRIGYVRYTLALEVLNDESTSKNNKQSVLVEVIDTRSRVLLLAGSPHPDMSAIKQALETNDKLTVDAKMVETWDKDLKDVELVFLFGLSDQRTRETAAFLREKKIPLFYMLDPRVSKSDVASLNIGLEYPSGKKNDEVQGLLNPSFSAFELSEEFESFMEKAPPLFVAFGEMKTKGEVFLYQRIGEINKRDPLIYFARNQQSRFGVVTGDGLWRWRMNEYQRTKDVKGFNELISRSIQYLMLRSNTYPLQLSFPERRNELEEMLIYAEFYNRSMEKITDSDIEMILQSPTGKTFDHSFAKSETDYRLNLGKLAPGKYKWKAKTSFHNESYSKEGEFVIDAVDFEKRSTRSDFFTLQQLSEQTGGAFFHLDEHQKLLSLIEARDDMVPVSYNESTYKKLIDLISYLALLLVVFSTEWFLRRYYGSY